jgi:starch synthase
MEGKEKAKETLQKEFGLPRNSKVPVIGMVTRLTDQKGVGDLFGPTYGSAWSICRDMDLQMVLLGSGESWCENEISGLASRLSNFKARIGYSEKLSHLIEAGSDFFLMPSRYEPCGLNQMYSLVYGTLPIVRGTGGLVDTVENFNEKTGGGTGFMFDYLSPSSIYDTVGWAVWAWYNRRADIEKMRKRGMMMDFSWELSAQKYVELYEETLKAVGVTVKEKSAVIEEEKPPAKPKVKTEPNVKKTEPKVKKSSVKTEPKVKKTSTKPKAKKTSVKPKAPSKKTKR